MQAEFVCYVVGTSGGLLCRRTGKLGHIRTLPTGLLVRVTVFGVVIRYGLVVPYRRFGLLSSRLSPSIALSSFVHSVLLHVSPPFRVEEFPEGHSCTVLLLIF
jgi:hypothetical protein